MLASCDEPSGPPARGAAPPAVGVSAPRFSLREVGQADLPAATDNSPPSFAASDTVVVGTLEANRLYRVRVEGTITRSLNPMFTANFDYDPNAHTTGASGPGGVAGDFNGLVVHLQFEAASGTGSGGVGSPDGASVVDLWTMYPEPATLKAWRTGIYGWTACNDETPQGTLDQDGNPYVYLCPYKNGIRGGQPYFAAANYLFEGGHSVSLSVVEAEIALTAAPTSVFAGDTVTFTLALTPDTVAGNPVPFEITAQRWVRDDGTEGAPPCTFYAYWGFPESSTCRAPVTESGTLYIDALVNGVAKSVSAHVTVQPVDLTLTADDTEVEAGDTVSFTASGSPSGVTLEVLEWWWVPSGAAVAASVTSRGGRALLSRGRRHTPQVALSVAGETDGSAESCAPGSTTCLKEITEPGTMYVRGLVNGREEVDSVQLSACDPFKRPDCLLPLTRADSTSIETALTKLRNPAQFADSTARRVCGELLTEFYRLYGSGNVYHGNPLAGQGSIDPHTGAYYNGTIHIDHDVFYRVQHDTLNTDTWLGILAGTLLHESAHSLGYQHPAYTQFPGSPYYSEFPFNHTNGDPSQSEQCVQ
jgi:plastocyanin